jgi:hypothetical protein
MDSSVATYQDFLARKSQADGMDGFEPEWMPDYLFPFQRELTAWAIRKGRAAIFADCGLGKTPMQLAWAENVRKHTGKPVLLATPLAVSYQTQAEAAKFGIDAAVSRDGSIPAGITITNYERLHHFDPDKFGGVVCDESSAIKAFDGTRRAVVTEFLRTRQFRLLCTATAAPNDYIELGTSSEALGYLGYMDMLGRFFVNDMQNAASRYRGQSLKWRFKGHASQPFWRWVSSWARAMRRPSDFGFSDDGFILPELILKQHVIHGLYRPDGELFERPANDIREERVESRRTLQQRCERAAELLTHSDTAVAWCQLNDEGNLLTELIPDAVQVSGADDVDKKEETLVAFGRGQIRALITKPIIGAWGLNWQHCNRMTFFPSHSYEQYYQAVRRCWRFGQKRPVYVDIVTTDGGINALKNLQRKSNQADQMFTELVTHMRDEMKVQRTADFTRAVTVPAWLTGASK